jgi:formylglycine-generating enzyme required for sulfatase activity
MGLAYTEDPTDAPLETTLRGARADLVRYRSVVAPIGEPDGHGLAEGSGPLRHPMEGKLMALVGEGVFPFGPQNQIIWLPSFYMDVTPVTNAEYAKFVAATEHRSPCHWPDGAFSDDFHDHPVVNVTHRDASAYATWAGKLLPTVEQWEKAARGDKGSTYPWGNQPTPAKCNEPFPIGMRSRSTDAVLPGQGEGKVSGS